MPHSCIRPTHGGSELVLRAKPRAPRSEVLGIRATPEGDALEVRLAASPVDGAANAELVTLLSRALGIPQRDIELLHGAAGRRKRVRILGLEPEQVLALLCIAPR